LKAFSDELKTKEEFSTSEGDRDVNKKKNRYKVMHFLFTQNVCSCGTGLGLFALPAFLTDKEQKEEQIQGDALFFTKIYYVLLLWKSFGTFCAFGIFN
jgi:hypothetical protein